MYGVFAVGVVAVTWPLAASPATLWPPHHDARVFTWVMTSMARRLITEPLTLFHGNAFYPSGESLAYTELLLPPSLLGLPGFLWGDPILTYNLLLLGLWPVPSVYPSRLLPRGKMGGWRSGGRPSPGEDTDREQNVAKDREPDTRLAGGEGDAGREGNPRSPSTSAWLRPPPAGDYAARRVYR
jgi:hypothetical protein